MDPGSRVGLVTGGTSGIGKAVCDALVASGWRVYASGRNLKTGSVVSQGVTGVRCDVREPADHAAAVDVVLRDTGRLDGLVTCAGIAPTGAFDAQQPCVLEDLLHTNVLGVMYACQAALEHLARTRGAIVMVGSTLADHPRPQTTAYAASKGALDSLTKGLAVEYGPQGVRVNCVRPSMVRTELMRKQGMSEATYEEALSKRAQDYPLRRIGTPHDVARLVRFLLSEESDWTTGSIVDVDGGHAAAGA